MMLELIATAIRSSPSFCRLSEDAGESQFAFYVMSRHLAALVVQTMRVPTPAMIEAEPFDDGEFNKENSVAHAIAFWHTMIDAILNEKEPA